MKKFKKLVASLLAVLMLLGVAPVTALAGEIELHHINTTQQPAEEPAQEPVLSSEDVLPDEDVAEAAEPAAVSSSGWRWQKSSQNPPTLSLRMSLRAVWTSATAAM